MSPIQFRSQLRDSMVCYSAHSSKIGPTQIIGNVLGRVFSVLDNIVGDLFV